MDKKVVSASKNRIVTYCVASNTFKVNTELTRKHIFTVLKASPYDPNIIAAGTKAGLVVIMSLKSKLNSFSSRRALSSIFAFTDMTITHTMRGHDTEIRSLDWIKAPQTPVEEEDLFGLYSCNDTENEFGVIKERRNDRTFDMDAPSGDKAMHEAIESMNEEAFDFAEACQALKQDIIAGKDDDKSPEKVKDPEYFDFAGVVGSQKSIKKADSDSFSETSEAPSRDNDFKSIENGVDNTIAVTNSSKFEGIMDDDLILLLSTAAEPRVWIWDSQKGCALDKIQLPTGGSKHSFKVKSFVAKWLNPFSIITNDQNGALCLWDIEYRDEARVSIHKSKKDFSAKAIVHLAVDRSSENFWSISLYTNITCHNQDSADPIYEYSTISSKTYEFAVNPIDPNVVAIAGYKRISLLNVSKMSHNYFVLNYMNSQLHSQVLTVAWHPEKENSIAFGTREGRIGIFYTSKLHHSPILMKPFFSKDVYSVTWGKFRASVTEEMAWTLFCCGFTGNAGHLVYFPQQGNTKFGELKDLLLKKRLERISVAVTVAAVTSIDAIFDSCDLDQCNF